VTSLNNESFSLFDNKITMLLNLIESGNNDIDFVDIGSSDGTSESNSFLLAKSNCKGFCAECDPVKFAAMKKCYEGIQNVRLSNERVTPSNVVPLLMESDVRTDFSFLSLDIDGYDYFVLESLLNVYRPKLICTEINEKIPYPVKFTVLYSDEYAWSGNHFYGMSLAKLEDICKHFNYKLIELDLYNAFLCPEEVGPHALDFSEAYTLGYKNRKRPAYNANVDHWLEIKDKKTLIDNIASFYHLYEGKYSIE